LFFIFSIANVLFAYSILSYSSGKEKEGICFSLIASLLYFWTWFQTFLNYWIFHFLATWLFIYGPYYLIKMTKLDKNISSNNKEMFFIWNVFLFLWISILLWVRNIHNALLSFSTVLTIFWLWLGWYLIISEKKQWLDKYLNYRNLTVIAQLLIMSWCLLSVINSIYQNIAITPLNISFLIFPLIIIISLFKSKNP
jgi:hypothetical protein